MAKNVIKAYMLKHREVRVEQVHQDRSESVIACWSRVWLNVFFCRSRGAAVSPYAICHMPHGHSYHSLA